MATLQEHRLKAAHNRDFLDSYRLSESEFVDWAVTVLFYCALHWLRALLAQEGYQVKNYRDEEDAITGTGVFTLQALAWYRHLKDSSRQARYETTEFSPSAYRDLRQSCFEPFRTFVTSKLRG
jgi:uncharacterized protein (UPF0332 family)